MARYLSEEAATADGFEIIHQPDRQRFVVIKDAEVVGEAHYSLLGASGIDFDHTVVVPQYRGTGISRLLARRAVTDEVVRGRRVAASCWFIEGYLAKHPELLGTADG
ncbi:GNAT family N-acetyltransferase [Leucobacter sp. W1478]|uniref:GNAT family N-acetyltransferase n=1 Tax=Leucobacter sp. W1478 TaxID=3439065 RepID=UPI003F3974BF